MATRRQSYVYIVTNGRCTVLYLGVTSDLQRRMSQHRNGWFEGFSKRYNLNRLVWFDVFADITNAIAREKQLKGWTRAKKIALIKSRNANWDDLAADWF